MTWNETDQVSLLHGMTADNEYSNIQQNHAHLYGYYDAHLCSAVNLGAAVTGTSYADVLKFWVPKNLDNNPIHVFCRAKMSGSASADGTIKVTEVTSGTNATGAIAAATSDVTELTHAFTLISLTPTGSADGRAFTIQAKAGAGGETCTLESVCITIGGSGSASTKGIKTSGFRTTGSALVYAATANISTEYIESLINGPVYISKDRPVCLASHLADVSRTAQLTTTSTNYEMVMRGMLPVPDNMQGSGRVYRVYAEMSQTGGATPAAKFVIGSLFDSPEISGAGWGSDTFTIDNASETGPRWVPFKVFLKRTGGSRASLNSFQIFRG